MKKILQERCCMCPKAGANKVCPPGYMKKKSSICCFVNTYTDRKGNDYQVVQTDTDLYQVCHQNREKENIREVSPGFHPHDNFDDAQEELNRAAVRRRWSVTNGCENGTSENGGGIAGRERQAEKENQWPD